MMMQSLPVLGIDEAGRGPVFGPMVMAGVLVQNEEERQWLERLGVDDSKKLSPQKREALAVLIKKLKHAYVVLEPSVLDAGNLNHLEMQGVGNLVAQLICKTLILDAPVAPPGMARFAALLGRFLPQPPPFLILENKADTKYPSCMAASILAKVERDQRVALLREKFGDFGSGYPSDPKTVSFLNSASYSQPGFSIHVRQKWGTIKKLSLSLPFNTLSPISSPSLPSPPPGERAG